MFNLKTIKMALFKNQTVNGNTVAINLDNVQRVSPDLSGKCTFFYKDGTSITVDELFAQTWGSIYAAKDTFGIAEVNISNAQVGTLHTTAVELLPAPGTGKFYQLGTVTFVPTGIGTNPTGGNFQIRVGSNTVLTALTSSLSTSNLVNMVGRPTGAMALNTSVVIGASAAVTLPTGSFKVFIEYKVLSA